jgi:hypothetical protein
MYNTDKNPVQGDILLTIKLCLGNNQTVEKLEATVENRRAGALQFLYSVVE